MNSIRPSRLAFLPPLAILAGGVCADVASITPEQDNTLIESSSPLSGGASPNVYAGRVGSTGNGLRRRVLLRFDVSSAVPPGSEILSATLSMTLTQTVSGPHVVSLHRATASWGEAGSSSLGGGGAPAEPGDATWTDRFHPDVAWASVGGDFVAVPSSSTTVASYGTYVWPSTAALVADVQGWLDERTANAGWIAIGDEATPSTVKQFASREAPDEATRPTLTVEFVPPVSCEPADLDCDGFVDGADLALLLAAWGDASPDDAADLTADGAVDGADLAVVLAQWSGR